MSKDTFILVAFCLFVLLLGMRMKQRFSQWRSERKGNADGTETSSGMMAGKEGPSRIRRLLFIIQIVVLGVLLLYMTPVLFREIIGPGRIEPVNLFLRCLIFIFTIYIFVFGCRKAFGRSDKGNTGK